MSVIDDYLSNITIGEALIAALISWILLDFWKRAVDSTVHDGLGLKRSWFNILLMALLLTAIFVAVLLIYNSTSSTGQSLTTDYPRLQYLQRVGGIYSVDLNLESIN